MVALAIRELDKRFGDTPVLQAVSLDVPDGAFAVLVGPSGCGKSTLLRLIAGLELPDGGSIRFGEREVGSLAPRDRDVAMVFQSYALYPHLCVRDNLAFGLRLRCTPAAEIARRIGEVSEMLGLSALLGRMPRELSGGQRQRVAMGRAIVRRPAVFLFDEPLSNLDAALRAQVRVDIRKLHQQLATTSVYVTHDQVEAMTLADVMFVLNQGRIEQAGEPLEIYARPATRFVAGFLGSPAMNFLEGRIERGEAVALGTGDARQELALDPADFGGALPDGRAVVLGIRPHDLVPAKACAAGLLRAKVVLTEELGGESYAHAVLAGESCVVRLDRSVRARPGDELVLRAETVHLFDPATGRSLRA
ncbi:MAG: sn-glycerol-3-phosphate ABC transporter ATP-binding protein UgpC [Deltaproteobacteria bacterium]|nr:sn-glycerol-3-phosphate ABC transporter ATP-binding protein UgpC [Deltaproteobacteria bacterium]